MRCKIHEHFTNERSLISCFTQSDKPEASFRTKMQFVLRLRWSNSNAWAKNNEVFEGREKKESKYVVCFVDVQKTEGGGWISPSTHILKSGLLYYSETQKSGSYSGYNHAGYISPNIKQNCFFLTKYSKDRVVHCIWKWQKNVSFSNSTKPNTVHHTEALCKPHKTLLTVDQNFTIDCSLNGWLFTFLHDYSDFPQVLFIQ